MNIFLHARAAFMRLLMRLCELKLALDRNADHNPNDHDQLCDARHATEERNTKARERD